MIAESNSRNSSEEYKIAKQNSIDTYHKEDVEDPQLLLKNNHLKISQIFFHLKDKNSNRGGTSIHEAKFGKELIKFGKAIKSKNPDYNALNQWAESLFEDFETLQSDQAILIQNVEVLKRIQMEFMNNIDRKMKFSEGQVFLWEQIKEFQKNYNNKTCVATLQELNRIAANIIERAEHGDGPHPVSLIESVNPSPLLNSSGESPIDLICAKALEVGMSKDLVDKLRNKLDEAISSDNFGPDLFLKMAKEFSGIDQEFSDLLANGYRDFFQKPIDDTDIDQILECCEKFNISETDATNFRTKLEDARRDNFPLASVFMEKAEELTDENEDLKDWLVRQGNTLASHRRPTKTPDRSKRSRRRASKEVSIRKPDYQDFTKTDGNSLSVGDQLNGKSLIDGKDQTYHVGQVISSDEDDRSKLQDGSKTFQETSPQNDLQAKNKTKLSFNTRLGLVAYAFTDDTITEFETKVKELETKPSEANDKSNLLKDGSNTSQETSTQTDLQAENDKLKKELEEVKEENSKLIEQKDELELKSLEMKKLETRLKKANETKISLESRLNSANKKVEESYDEIVRLNTRMSHAEDTIVELKDNLITEGKMTRKSAETITELETQLKTAENQQLQLEIKVYESDKTITSLREKLAESNDTITGLKTQLTDAEKTIRIREEALTLSSTNSEKSVGEINRLLNENSRLNSVIAVLNKIVKGLSDENQENEELLESARSIIREADHQNKTLSLQLPSEVGTRNDTNPVELSRQDTCGGNVSGSDEEIDTKGDSDLESVKNDFGNATRVQTHGGYDGDSDDDLIFGNFSNSLFVENQQQMDGSNSTGVKIAWNTPVASEQVLDEESQREFPVLSPDGDIVPKKGHLIELGKDKMGAQQLMSSDDDSSSTPMNDKNGDQQHMSSDGDDSVDSSSTPTHEEMLEDAIRYDLEDKKKGRGKPKMKDGPSKSKKETALINKNEQRQSTPTDVDNPTEVRGPSPSYGEGRDKATITGVDNSVRHQNHQSGKNDSGKTGKWKDKKGKKKGGRGRLTGK